MKPALSIVVFTVMSGGGLGLAAMLAIFDSLPPVVFAAFALLTFLLVAVGTVSSTFHLANPKNAWRALSRVRTSWLSREAVAAMIFFPLFVGWAWLHTRHYELIWLRGAVVAVAGFTVFCTAMIYQSLKPIAAWCHPLTAFNYLIFAAQSGAMLFVWAAFAGAYYGYALGPAKEVGELVSDIWTSCYVLMGCTLAAVVGKFLHYRRLGKATDIRVGRAIGFTQAQARLLDAGHSAPTFLNREFIFEVSAAKLQRLRVLAMLLYGLSPILPMLPLSPFFGLTKISILLSMLGAILLFAGLLIERWLFFAEARHAVRAFHGMGAP